MSVAAAFSVTGSLYTHDASGVPVPPPERGENDDAPSAAVGDPARLPVCLRTGLRLLRAGAAVAGHRLSEQRRRPMLLIQCLLPVSTLPVILFLRKPVPRAPNSSRELIEMHACCIRLCNSAALILCDGSQFVSVFSSFVYH
jgi:hypothetical protein